MNTLDIVINETFVLNTIVRESDKYTESVLVKMRKQFPSGTALAPDEIYITVEQLEQLGSFMLRRAEEIKEEQKIRKGE